MTLPFSFNINKFSLLFKRYSTLLYYTIHCSHFPFILLFDPFQSLLIYLSILHLISLAFNLFHLTLSYPTLSHLIPHYSTLLHPFKSILVYFASFQLALVSFNLFWFIPIAFNPVVVCFTLSLSISTSFR
jgi:hypothetical protein